MFLKDCFIFMVCVPDHMQWFDVWPDELFADQTSDTSLNHTSDKSQFSSDH